MVMLQVLYYFILFMWVKDHDLSRESLQSRKLRTLENNETNTERRSLMRNSCCWRCLTLHQVPSETKEKTQVLHVMYCHPTRPMLLLGCQVWFILMDSKCGFFAASRMYADILLKSVKRCVPTFELTSRLLARSLLTWDSAMSALSSASSSSCWSLRNLARLLLACSSLEGQNKIVHQVFLYVRWHAK